MKKFALIAATLICFAGCARNDTSDMGATDTTATDTTGTGASASGQSGTDSASITSPPMDTNSALDSSSSSLNLDTNNISEPSPQLDSSTTPPPTPPSTEPAPAESQPPSEPPVQPNP